MFGLKKRQPRLKFRRKNRSHARKPAIKGLTNTTRTIMSVNAIPDRMNVKLTYSDIFTASTTSAASNLTIRGNGPFDPDQTGTGHQPRGFDEWSSFYSSYVVLSSTLELVPICTVGSAVVGVYPTNTAGGPGTVLTVLERPRVHYRTLQAGGNPSTKITTTQSTISQLGLDKTEIFDSDYSAATNSNPIQQWYWVVSKQHPDLATNSTVSLIWKITYNVMFFNRKLLSQS